MTAGPIVPRTRPFTGLVSRYASGAVHAIGRRDLSHDTQSAGGCLCRRIRYAAAGEPLTVAYCHCASCRKHSGAPVVAWVAYETRHVKWTEGTRAKYESSPGVMRSFCSACGTPLTWEGESRREGGKLITEFHISTLDDPDAFTPTNHIFYPERSAWFDIADELPRFQGFDSYSEICATAPVRDGLPGREGERGHA